MAMPTLKEPKKTREIWIATDAKPGGDGSGDRPFQTFQDAIDSLGTPIGTVNASTGHVHFKLG